VVLLAISGLLEVLRCYVLRSQYLLFATEYERWVAALLVDTQLSVAPNSFLERLKTDELVTGINNETNII